MRKPKRLKAIELAKTIKLSNEGELTNGILQAVVIKAFSTAARKSKRLTGYTIKVHNGWVVRESRNGRITRIEKIATENHHSQLCLD